MRAAFYDKLGPADEVLTVGEQPTPEPGPGEVRVKLQTSGVNPSDWKARLRGRGGNIPAIFCARAARVVAALQPSICVAYRNCIDKAVSKVRLSPRPPKQRRRRAHRIPDVLRYARREPWPPF